MPDSIPKLRELGNEAEVTLCSPFGQNMFYLRENHEDDSLRELQDALNQLEPNLGNSMQEGDMCLGKRSVDGNWARGIVHQIQDEEYTVNFVDYGETEILDSSKLADCPEEHKKAAPFIVLCSIVDIEPVEEVYPQCSEFSDICSGKLMAKAVRSKEVCGKTVAEIVLLKKFPPQEKRLYINLKQFLIFAGYANPVGEYVRIDLNNIQKVRTDQCPQLAVSEKPLPCSVMCTYAYCPSWFYLTMVDYHSPATGKPLNDHMELLLERGDPHIKVFLPYKGLCCVVKDETWFRVKVTSIIDRDQVEVYYVDTGKTAFHSYDELYLPDPQILKRPGTAIRCKQIGIEPLNGKKWNIEALKRFHVILEKFSEDLKALFIQQVEDSGVWLVDLKVMKEKLISVGQHLVKKNCAVFTGCSSFEGDTRIISTFEKQKKSKRLTALESFEKNRSQIYSNDGEEDNDNCISKDSLGNIRAEVYPVTVISPSEIYVMLSMLKNHYEKMRSSLSEIPKKLVAIENLEVYNLYCIQRSGKRYGRVKIINITGKRALVELLDEGPEITVDVDQFCELPEDLALIPPFVHGVMLSHIIPTCGQEQWSQTSITSLKEMTQAHKKLYIVRSGSRRKGPSGRKVCPVFLSWQEETESGMEYPTINQALVKEGLAFQAKSFHVDLSPEKDKSVKIPKKKLPSSSKDKVQTSSEKSDAEVPVSSECFITAPLEAYRAWGEPDPPDDKFPGITSYIDAEGKIFVQPYENAELLEEIAQYFSNKYGESPAMNHDLNWNVGMPVIARYHQDGNWYRGTILSDNIEVKVLFVDYGNVEVCSYQDIRTELDMYGGVPILAYKCHLDGVQLNTRRSPNEKMFNRIHSQTVGKNVEVVVLDTVENSTELKVNMTFSGSNRDVAKHLKMYSCFQPFAEGVPENLLWLPERLYEIYLASLFEEFGDQPIPIVVSHIENVCKVFYKLRQSSKTDSHIFGRSGRFKEMHQIWQRSERYNDACLVVGEMCLAQNTTTNAWERLIIEKVEKKCLHVLWLDQGKSELIPKTGLKQLPEEGKFVPPACQCLMIEVATPGNRRLSELDNKPVMDYLLSRKRLYASFKSTLYIPKAELFYEDSDGKLKPCCYPCSEDI